MALSTAFAGLLMFALAIKETAGKNSLLLSFFESLLSSVLSSMHLQTVSVPAGSMPLTGSTYKAVITISNMDIKRFISSAKKIRFGCLYKQVLSKICKRKAGV